MVETCAHSLETNLSKKKAKRARKVRAKVEMEEMEAMQSHSYSGVAKEKARIVPEFCLHKRSNQGQK